MPTSAPGTSRRMTSHRPPVGEKQVVGHPQGLGGVAVARGVVPLFVAQGRDAPGFVVGDPARHPVAQRRVTAEV